jgi:hypothetical protein
MGMLSPPHAGMLHRRGSASSVATDATTLTNDSAAAGSGLFSPPSRLASHALLVISMCSTIIIGCSTVVWKRLYHRSHLAGFLRIIFIHHIQAAAAAADHAQ